MGHYADRALASYVLDGVRLEADVELQAVFVPHLTSLPMGWSSVLRELERKASLSWYELYSDLSFFPSYWLGKGAAARKLEPDRWRETTEGGGPRTLTVDASGLPAISINDASRIHHMPRPLCFSSRSPVLCCLAALPWPASSRGAAVILPAPPLQQVAKRG